MSRTDLDPTTLASSLRRMAGDGSVEWVHEPMQTSVLFDIADMLDELEFWHRLTAGIELPEYPITEFKSKDLERENAKLRKLLSIMAYCNQFRRDCDGCSLNGAAGIITERAGCDELLASLRELGVEVPDGEV